MVPLFTSIYSCLSASTCLRAIVVSFDTTSKSNSCMIAKLLTMVDILNGCESGIPLPGRCACGARSPLPPVVVVVSANDSPLREHQQHQQWHQQCDAEKNALCCRRCFAFAASLYCYYFAGSPMQFGAIVTDGGARIVPHSDQHTNNCRPISH